MDPTFKGLGTPTPTKVKPQMHLPRWLLYVGAFVVLALVATVIAMMITPKSDNIKQRLLYRIDALSSLTSDARPNIQSGDLAKINSELSLMLTNDGESIKKVIAAAKLNDTLKSIRTQEQDKATDEKLKTARINGSFDSAYKTVLIQKIEATIALLQEVYTKNATKKQKPILDSTYKNLNNYLAQLKALP